MSQLVSGVLFSDKKSPFEIQLWLFKYSIKMSEDPYWRPVGRSSTPYSGEGRFEHFKILAQACFPEVFEWNDWADEIGRLLCEGRHSAISGCAGPENPQRQGFTYFSGGCVLQMIPQSSLLPPRLSLRKNASGRTFAPITRSCCGSSRSYGWHLIRRTAQRQSSATRSPPFALRKRMLFTASTSLL